MIQHQNSKSLEALLEDGCQRLGIDAGNTTPAYLQYIKLLTKWNNTYNLTAIKEPEEMLYRHVLDSLSVHSFIEGERCIDIGTGAGLPGLILALAQPEKKWTLLDSNQKKLRFIQHVKTTLNINNIEIVHTRVEDFKPQQGFDTVVCRAFSSMENYLSSVKHLCELDCAVLAMKAAKAEEECLSIKNLCKYSEIILLDVPGADGQRALIKVSL